MRANAERRQEMWGLVMNGVAHVAQITRVVEGVTEAQLDVEAQGCDWKERLARAYRTTTIPSRSSQHSAVD